MGSKKKNWRSYYKKPAPLKEPEPLTPREQARAAQHHSPEMERRRRMGIAWSQMFSGELKHLRKRRDLRR